MHLNFVSMIFFSCKDVKNDIFPGSASYVSTSVAALASYNVIGAYLQVIVFHSYHFFTCMAIEIHALWV